MIPRKIRYLLFAFVLGSLITGNIAVHILSINLSERSLFFEKEMTALRQSNLKLESEVITESTLQNVAAFAASQGYKSSGPAIRWMDPVIAARQ